MNIPVSTHGSCRIQQRGLSSRILEVILAYADIDLHAGNGCETIRLSRKAARALAESGELNPDHAARACRIALVFGRRGLVTALRPSSGRHGRRYRRQLDTRARRIVRAGR